jgi:Glycosyl transferase family 2
MNRIPVATQQQYRFTIFTPTYNRSTTLHRAYESLCAQTYRNFEWLIVDDGSTDHTRNLVEQWQQEASFPIRYLYQDNQGKHVAYNIAALKANGELLVCLDSDDGCVATALERFNVCWESLSLEERSQYSGIDCHCMNQEGQKIGTDYPIAPGTPGLIANYSKMRLEHQVEGEKWGFQRTAVMREFLFPTLTEFHMNHIPEAIAWIPMTQKYPVLYVNEWLRIYYQDHHTEQLTKSNILMTNPLGVWMVNQTALKWEMKYFTRSPLHFVKLAANYGRSNFHLQHRYAKNPVFKRAKQQELARYQLPIVSPGGLLSLICTPIAYLLYCRDLARYGT